MQIYGNILDASMAGGVFVNGGGNVTVHNNIILNGRTSQLLVYSYNRPLSHGCPASKITNNILSMHNTETDAQRTGTAPDGSKQMFEGGGVRFFGGFFMSPTAHTTGTCSTTSVLSSVDNNVFWNPALGAAGTASRGLFGSVGVPVMTLKQWQANALTGIAPDAHSVVADPQFEDAAAGNFRLKASSPALKLGFEQIPPIVAPEAGAGSICI